MTTPFGGTMTAFNGTQTSFGGTLTAYNGAQTAMPGYTGELDLGQVRMKSLSLLLSCIIFTNPNILC